MADRDPLTPMTPFERACEISADLRKTRSIVCRTDVSHAERLIWLASALADVDKELSVLIQRLAPEQADATEA